MPKPITREEAAQYRESWQRVAARERQELRAMTMDERVRRTAALFASAKSIGWVDEQRDADVAFTRERWRQLREVLGGK